VIAFVASVLLILAAGIAGVALSNRAPAGRRAFRVLLGTGCVLGAVPAFAAIGGADIGEIRIDSAVPGGAWVFGIDALSAIFVLAILASGAASAFYGTWYLDGGRPSRRADLAHLGVALLVAALLLVVTARAVVPFLIAWETMALAAYVLVIHEHEHAQIRRAGLLYLVATHAGTLALFALFAAWGAGAADLTFASLARSGPLAGGAFVLVLALLGFGMKAGLVPLHFWLPEAHAAAPSHISALMSGIVIKMGVYGLLRVIVLYGAPPAWFGWLVLGLGATSAVLGVVWALAQHDLKRLLAYHSVENIGIILLGMGAGSLGLAYGRPTVAVLGFAGAALHTLNHALFKSLLFLGAGAVAHGTGTREIDHLGGLARTMPRTAMLFLVGSAAIVGLPPLNGFVSEWLVLLSLLRGGIEPGGTRIAILAAAALGLIGALALACFAKVLGIIYLGVPRHHTVAGAHEPPRGMIRPMVALAAGCAAIGLLPLLIVPLVLRVGSLVARAPEAAQPDVLAVPITVFTLGLGAALALAWLLRTRLAPAASATTGDVWACGYDRVSSRMQYTASSFAAPLISAYRPVAGVRVLRSPHTLATEAVDPVLRGVLTPVWRGARSAAALLRPIQRGRLPLYIAYLGGALVLLLIYLLAAGPD
jgi:formate hydrogenlyase subunit 3/multisubunit Na+/H+ antiporter MnhD subunit